MSRATSRFLSPRARRFGLVWVVVTIPCITVVSHWATTPDRYILLLVLGASIPYTTPGLFFGWQVIRQAPRNDVMGYGLLYAGLIVIKLIGLGLLVGLLTGWTWGNALSVPAVALAGVSFCTGLTLLVQQRSGRRALAVDVVEAASSVVAVLAPLVVVWGPTVLEARARWFALGAALTLVFCLWATYWGMLLLVRLGPGRDALDTVCMGLCGSGVLNAGVQVAQGVSGFTLPTPPLLAVHALCASMFLLIPLCVPRLMRPGRLAELPPHAQVRGSRVATVAVLSGVGALLAATIALRAEREWAVTLALGAVSLLIVLGALRQILATEETRRLYAEVQVASEQRRRLLQQLLDRSLQDRRRFAGQLYEQAMVAYTSFHVLAGSDRWAGLRSGYGVRRGNGRGAVIAAASARIGGEMARNAESVRGLVLAIKPANDERNLQARLGIPITAYLDTLYDHRPTPRLDIEVAESLRLGWIVETVLLQVVQEALHNVWAHSGATSVDVTISSTDSAGAAAILRIRDDGRGFDPATTAERSGFTTMRAAVAVVGGSLLVDAHPDEGTTVTARLANDA